MDTGVAGTSEHGYGGDFYSSGTTALYASGPSGAWAGVINNRGGPGSPGLYVNGSLFVTGAKSGYVVNIAVNDGPESLETGDVVVVTGYAPPVAGETPVLRVRLAAEAGSTAVVGVVDQPYVISSNAAAEGGQALPKPAGAHAERAAGTAVAPGQYLSVVTHGAFKAVKVDATFGSIQPGDLLVASSTPGHVMRAGDALRGTIVGKAMDALASGTGVVPVLVTLQ